MQKKLYWFINKWIAINNIIYNCKIKCTKKHTEMHGGKSVCNSLAVPATVIVRAPPSTVLC